MLSVLLRFTDSDYLPLVSLIYGFWLPPFGIFDLRILITPLVSLIYGFWLPPFGIFDLRILITSLWYLQTLLDHNERGRAQRPVTPVRSWAGVIRGVAHHSTGGNMTHYHIKWDIIIIYFSIIIANGEYTWYWFLWTFCNRKCDFDILEYALLFSMVVLRESIAKCESLAIC